jgi:hypothetical protein
MRATERKRETRDINMGIDLGGKPVITPFCIFGKKTEVQKQKNFSNY